MSDFFYKEKLGPVFSPVINVKQENISQAVVSALDNLLSPTGNMFTRAETVRNLMKIEKLSLEQTAKALSLNLPDVANKLRLLEFTQKERRAILDHGFSEASALEFLRLDKISRLYAMEYCRKNEFDADGIKDYVDSAVESKKVKKEQTQEKIESVRKFVINDIGFLFNSIENILRLARNAGFEVDNKTSENSDFYDIHISVKKQGLKNGKVDKKSK
ncbi:MAG: hypothetical protein IJ939_01950 [Clostridia bacterium]|nr:hypothetical protein [Clostridia bacterium]